MKTLFRSAILTALALSSLATPALAQRDPAYQAARAAGQVGEKPDGYLGFIGTPPDAVRALVDDLNLRRRAVYSERARAAGSTVEQMAFTTGCNLIAQTVAGERYMTPTGEWATRTAAAPIRDARCV